MVSSLVRFPKLDQVAAEEVVGCFLDEGGRTARELLEKLLCHQIDSTEYLHLLKNALETRYDDYCDLLESERRERLSEMYIDEHENCEVRA